MSYKQETKPNEVNTGAIQMRLHEVYGRSTGTHTHRDHHQCKGSTLNSHTHGNLNSPSLKASCRNDPWTGSGPFSVRFLQKLNVPVKQTHRTHVNRHLLHRRNQYCMMTDHSSKRGRSQIRETKNNPKQKEGRGLVSIKMRSLYKKGYKNSMGPPTSAYSKRHHNIILVI